jgi:adenosylcobinamide-phosphate synthase
MLKFLILSSFILDLIFGDPPLIFTHPIVCIGKIISFFEKFFYTFKNKKLSGIFFTCFILFLVIVFSKILIFIFSFFNTNINFLLCAVLGSFTISLRSLHFETLKVYNALKKHDILKAKNELSFLVSRDTEELRENDIIRSVIETISENINDGIIAPLFYFSIAGIVGAFVYKAVNTLDSMIGYKNEKYFYFGWFSAKLDDILNFVPARITGILIVIASFLLQYNFKKSFKIMLRDKDKTDSPNSGYPEAAVAGALNIQLGGPTPYFGVWYDKPYIGEKMENLNLKHIEKSYRLMYTVSFIFIIIIMVIVK